MTHPGYQLAYTEDRPRLKLAAYRDKRITVVGWVGQYDVWTQGWRKFGVCCVKNIEMGGEKLATHAWVLPERCSQAPTVREGSEYEAIPAQRVLLRSGLALARARTIDSGRPRLLGDGQHTGAHPGPCPPSDNGFADRHAGGHRP